MRFVIFLSFVLVCCSTWAQAEEAELRDFTDEQGRVIRAEIVLVKLGEVHLKRDGKVFQFPFLKLSKKDQAFVRQWAKENVQYWFSFKPKVVSDPKKRTSDGSGKTKTVRTVGFYDLEIGNRSGIAARDIRLEYRIAVRRDWKLKSSSTTRQQVHYLLAGESSIPYIENSKRVVLRLKEVNLLDAKWRRTKRYTVSYSNGRTESRTLIKDYSMAFILDGIWVKLFLGDRMIGEYKSGEKTMKDMNWGRRDGYDVEATLQRIIASSL